MRSFRTSKVEIFQLDPTPGFRLATPMALSWASPDFYPPPNYLRTNHAEYVSLRKSFRFVKHIVRSEQLIKFTLLAY